MFGFVAFINISAPLRFYQANNLYMPNAIKTYQKVNPDEPENYFRMNRMEAIYEYRNGKKDDPHRHDYYTVILVEKANGFHMVDFNNYAFSEKQVFFVSPGQVHQVVEENKPKGFVLLFSPGFLAQNNISEQFIDELNLFNSIGQAPPLHLHSEAYYSLKKHCVAIEQLIDHEKLFNQQAIGAYLNLFLIECTNLCVRNKKENTQKHEAGKTILRHFKQLLSDKYNIWHQGNSYAEALHVSPDHLNRVVKSLTGFTTKENIQNTVLLHAKRLFYFTDLSAKEIAYELGFSEPGNFSSFFKKHTGISPSKYRS